MARVFYPNQDPEKNPDLKRELRFDQLEAIYRLVHEFTEPMKSRSALVGAGMGSGKAQPLDSLVLTPSGFVRMGDISVGSEIVTPSGAIAPVSGVFPQGERPVYRLELIDGREVLADEGHLWTVLDRNRRRGGSRVMSTKEMVDAGPVSRNGNARFQIDTISPVDLGEWQSSLDPWLIGALLGNGGLARDSVMFSSGDTDTLDRVRATLPPGVTLRHAGNYDYQITSGRLGGYGRNPVLNELRRLGIMGHGAWTKAVPSELMNSTIEDRLALVQGLLDTDGSAVRAGFEFSSASPELGAGFAWLVRSLGGRATLSKKSLNGKVYQRVYGRLPEGMLPFRCARKLGQMTPATKYALTSLAVRSITPVGAMQTQCIMVDHPDHEYVTDHFTRTHNTVVSVEVVLKVKPIRCLIVGVKDAYGQWRDAFKDQGESRPLRRIDSSAPGLDNLARLVDGDPGLFYVGLEMLRAKDWHEVSETIVFPDYIVKMFGGEKTMESTTTEQKHTFANMEPVDLLISDESHKHSSQKSKSIETIRSIPARCKMALSGTFYGNKFENAWSLTTWLWGKKVIGTKGAFERDFCVKEPVMSKDGRTQLKSRNGFPLSKITGERIPGEFVETLPCYVFIATPIGKPPEPEVVRVDLGPEEGRQYREMEKQALTWIKDTKGKRAPLVADLPLTQRLRLRTAALGEMTLVPGKSEEDSDSITFSPGCKSSTLTELHHILHRPTWVGKKALILTHSLPFAIETARRIGQKYTVGLKVGGVTDWDETKRRFMLPVSETGSIQYLVAVISAVGTATDGLQKNCAKVVWLSLDDNTTNNLQGSNRVWRDGVDLEAYEAVQIVQRGTIAEGVLAKDERVSAGISRSVRGNV